MRFSFPLSYGLDSTLVEIDLALIPFVGGALSLYEQRYVWATDADYEAAYNAFAQLQEELMGKGIARLQMEIRAMRGVDDLTPGYNDPTVDPFTLSLGTIEDNKRAIEAVTAKSEEIRLLVAAMQTSEDIGEIKIAAQAIAALLAV